MAHFSGLLGADLEQVADLIADPQVLDKGWWAVVGTFEGALTGYRFGTVRPAPLPRPQKRWLPAASWTSSMPKREYLAGVQLIRERIAAGDVYQVNLCRLLSADLDPDADPLALAGLLARGNPAPYAGVLIGPDGWVVSASPELFLERIGDHVRSGPIKGTAQSGKPFAAKDYPENIMITDLVRHDLGRVARAGTVRVERLAVREEHPGLAHLVSVVGADLLPGVGWPELFAATLPPGSVSGAPKHTALQVIGRLESVPRGPYCGMVGYVDGDRHEARLAVGIRTFFTTSSNRRLHFGTGAGITYASDPVDEWNETELKAATLIGIASGGQI
jgi:para-aminobenzoate synthetase component 1